MDWISFKLHCNRRTKKMVAREEGVIGDLFTVVQLAITFIVELTFEVTDGQKMEEVTDGKQ